MFITIVNGQIAHRHPSIIEVANSMRTLDPGAASYVEVFELVGNGNDVLRRISSSETGEGITPASLDKYKHRVL